MTFETNSNNTQCRHPHFVSLKANHGLFKDNKPPNIFNRREFSDEFIKSLIYCIETDRFDLYGYVILSDQVHLIICSDSLSISHIIDRLKTESSKCIFRLAGQKIIAENYENRPVDKELRRLVGQLVNAEPEQLWEKDTFYAELSSRQILKHITPISTTLLLEYLANSDRNYLQLGAEAFTRLMLDTMRL